MIISASENQINQYVATWKVLNNNYNVPKMYDFRIVINKQTRSALDERVRAVAQGNNKCS